MSINAIKQNEHKSHQASYLKSAALGGLSGYALKYILPVNGLEKADGSTLLREGLQRETKVIKSKEIEAIRNSQPRSLAADEFIRLVDKKEVTVSKIKALKEPVSSEVMDIIAKINEKGREAKLYGEEVLIAITKRIRPTKTFIAMGSMVALSTTLVYNALAKLSQK